MEIDPDVFCGKLPAPGDYHLDRRRDGLQILRFRRGAGTHRARHQLCSEPLPAQPAAGAVHCFRAPRDQFPGAVHRRERAAAWAAGSGFMLTQALLGFLPDAPRNKLYVDPSLPVWLSDLTMRDLRVGKHKLDIRFWREGEETAFEVITGEPQAGRALRAGIQDRAAKDRLRSDLADKQDRLDQEVARVWQHCRCAKTIGYFATNLSRHLATRMRVEN